MQNADNIQHMAQILSISWQVKTLVARPCWNGKALVLPDKNRACTLDKPLQNLRNMADKSLHIVRQQWSQSFRSESAVLDLLSSTKSPPALATV